MGGMRTGKKREEREGEMWPERVESMIVEHRTIGGIRFGSVDGIWVVREWPGDGSRE